MVCFKIQNVNWKRAQHTPAHLPSDRQAACKMQTASSCSEEKKESGHFLLPYREATKENTGEPQNSLYFFLFHVNDTFLSTVVARISVVKPSLSLCLETVGRKRRGFVAFQILLRLLLLVTRSFCQSSDSGRGWYCLIIMLYRKTWAFLDGLFLWFADIVIIAFWLWSSLFMQASAAVKLKLQIVYLLLMERLRFSVAFFGMVTPFHPGKCHALVVPLVDTKLQLLFI